MVGLRRASLRRSCGLGPVVLGVLDSVAPARGMRGASLVDFAGKWWFWGSEAVVGSLWNASLCPDGSFGLFFGSEAVVAGLWRASLRRSCKEL